jgi:hypothetical protein
LDIIVIEEEILYAENIGFVEAGLRNKTCLISSKTSQGVAITASRQIARYGWRGLGIALF